jgi:hypothetical protein
MFNQEPIGQGNVSKTGDVATPVDKDGSIESPEGDPLHVSFLLPYVGTSSFVQFICHNSVFSQYFQFFL